MLGKMLIAASIMLARCSVGNNEVAGNEIYENFREKCMFQFEHMLHQASSHFENACDGIRMRINDSIKIDAPDTKFNFEFEYIKENKKISKKQSFNCDEIIQLLKTLRQAQFFSPAVISGYTSLKRLNDGFKSVFNEAFNQKSKLQEETLEKMKKEMAKICKAFSINKSHHEYFSKRLSIIANNSKRSGGSKKDDVDAQNWAIRELRCLIKDFLNICFLGNKNPLFSETIGKLPRELRAKLMALYQNVDADTKTTFN